MNFFKQSVKDVEQRENGETLNYFERLVQGIKAQCFETCAHREM